MKNQEKTIAKISSLIAGVISLAILIRYYSSGETVHGIIAIYLLILSVSIKIHEYHIKEDE